MTPQQRKDHFRRVAAYPCWTCGAFPPTLHHCHGPSMQRRGVYKAMGAKTSDYLVLPLCRACHQGPEGIDGGIGSHAWEAKHGEQASMLDELSRRLGYDVWQLAAAERLEKLAKRGSLSSSKIIRHDGVLR